MEVAPHYELPPLLTLFILLKLPYTAKTLACMFIVRLKRYWSGLMQIVAKSVSGVGDWSGYPLDCFG